MRYFHILFWPLLVAAFIVAFIQLKDKTYLQNDTAPQGIVSLELGGSYQRDTAIIQSWKTDTLDRTSVTLCQPTPQPINRLRKARFDVQLDYLFIFLYTLLGIIIVVVKNDGGSTDVLVTVFTTTLAALIGLFVKSPTN